MIYYYTTGWLHNEAFTVSIWNKKNSSCSLNAEKTVFVNLDQNLQIMTFFIQSDSNRVCE